MFMMRLPTLFLATFFAASGTLCGPLQAQEALPGPFGGAAKREVSATAEVVAEVLEIAPGEPFRVALKITHAPHWHT